jgi:molybdopterin molybdotransferase
MIPDKAVLGRGDVTPYQLLQPSGTGFLHKMLQNRLFDSAAEHATRHDPGVDFQTLFGLPGNPVAVMVTFLAFVRPTLERMMGMHRQPLPLLKARSREVLRKKPGRTEYQRGIVSTNAKGDLQVITTGNQGSGVLSSMVQANGLIVLHHEQETTQIGEWVDVMMFDGHI